jgi:hypothetical protein
MVWWWVLIYSGCAMLILLCCRKGSAMWHHERINSCKKVQYIYQHAFSPELGGSGLMTPVELYIFLDQNIKGWSNCCQTASSSKSWCRVTEGQQQQLLAQVTKTVTLNKDCCWSTADCCYLHRCSSDLTHDAALLTLFHFLRGTYWMFRSPAGRRPTMQQLRRPSRFSRQKVHEEGPVNCDTAFMLHASSTSVRLDQTKSISSILPLVWFQSDNRGSLAV